MSFKVFIDSFSFHCGAHEDFLVCSHLLQRVHQSPTQRRTSGLPNSLKTRRKLETSNEIAPKIATGNSAVLIKKEKGTLKSRTLMYVSIRIYFNQLNLKIVHLVITIFFLSMQPSALL